MVVCALCHKSFSPEYMLKVEAPPYSYQICYDCGREVGHPAIFVKDNKSL